MQRAAYRRKFARVVHPFCTHLWSDDYWVGVSKMRDAIEDAFPDCELETWVENGGYKNYFDEFGQTKEWELKLETPEGYEMKGKIIAYAAGTIDDPFKSYDMTASIW